MAASNEWFEYHLTPRGWELGSNKTDFASEDKDPPPDRVLTVRLSEYLSSSFSKMDRGHEELWRSPDSERVATLMEQFGSSPR
jgi:hypothetical protein